MIASLEGTITAIGTDYLVVAVGGVGFWVHVPQNLPPRVGTVGEPVRLYTHLHVRENDLALYGFATSQECQLFQTLLGVSGIGPRLALSVLSTFTPESLRTAVSQERADLLAQVPGVGLKTARRLVFHLKDKMAPGAPKAFAPLSDQDAEVIAALTALGYSVVEAQTALQSLPPDPEMSLEERIRLALAYFG